MDDEKYIFNENKVEFQKLLNFSHDLISIMDINAKTIWSNKAWKELFQGPIDQENPYSRIHPDDAKRVEKKWVDLATNGVPIRSMEYRIKDAKEFYRTFETSAIKVGEHLYIFAHDISARKIVENELKDRVTELKLFNKIAIGRELKIAELKKIIVELENK